MDLALEEAAPLAHVAVVARTADSEPMLLPVGGQARDSPVVVAKLLEKAAAQQVAPVGGKEGAEPIIERISSVRGR